MSKARDKKGKKMTDTAQEHLCKTGIMLATVCMLSSQGCSTQRQVKLRVPFHPEYSHRISQNHKSLDEREKIGALNFFQIDIEP
jgi:hypothetical protein